MSSLDGSVCVALGGKHGNYYLGRDSKEKHLILFSILYTINILSKCMQPGHKIGFIIKYWRPHAYILTDQTSSRDFIFSCHPPWDQASIYFCPLWCSLKFNHDIFGFAQSLCAVFNEKTAVTAIWEFYHFDLSKQTALKKHNICIKQSLVLWERRQVKAEFYGAPQYEGNSPSWGENCGWFCSWGWFDKWDVELQFPTPMTGSFHYLGWHFQPALLPESPMETFHQFDRNKER